jgi:hypothetical protein
VPHPPARPPSFFAGIAHCGFQSDKYRLPQAQGGASISNEILAKKNFNLALMKRDVEEAKQIKLVLAKKF